MAEQASRLVSFADDGGDVVAVDDRGKRFRTPRGVFLWRPDLAGNHDEPSPAKAPAPAEQPRPAPRRFPRKGR